MRKINIAVVCDCEKYVDYIEMVSFILQELFTSKGLIFYKCPPPQYLFENECIRVKFFNLDGTLRGHKADIVFYDKDIERDDVKMFLNPMTSFSIFKNPLIAFKWESLFREWEYVFSSLGI